MNMNYLISEFLSIAIITDNQIGIAYRLNYKLNVEAGYPTKDYNPPII